MSLRDPEHVIDAEFRSLPTGPNWARGFFRVWVLLSAAWCVFAAMLVEAGAHSTIPGHDPDWFAALPFFVFPSLLIGAAMAFIGWVIRGFSR